MASRDCWMSKQNLGPALSWRVACDGVLCFGSAEDIEREHQQI